MFFLTIIILGIIGARIFLEKICVQDGTLDSLINTQTRGTLINTNSRGATKFVFVRNVVQANGNIISQFSKIIMTRVIVMNTCTNII